MASSTTVIRERLIAIADAIDDFTGHQIATFEKGEANGIGSDLIPGYIVYWPGLAEHRYFGRELITERRWMLEFIIAEFTDNEPLSKQEAYEACEPYLDSLALYFAQHNGLRLESATDGTDTGLSGVSIMTFRDGGVGEFSRGGKRYASIGYPVVIGTNTDF